MKCDLCPSTIDSATEHYNFTIRSSCNEVGDQLDISCCSECAKRLVIPCLAAIKLMREASKYIKERNKPPPPKKKECYHGPGVGCENCFRRMK